MTPFDPIELLRVLSEHHVDFVVIGGFAAWMQGSPALTTDVDVVFGQAPENVERLVTALRALSAVYKDPLGRRIEPDTSRLTSRQGGGHHLFTTSAGDLDVLRQSNDWDYDRLIENCVEMEVAGARVRFATLEAVLDMKTQAGRPKDLLGIANIKAAIEARRADEEGED